MRGCLGLLSIGLATLAYGDDPPALGLPGVQGGVVATSEPLATQVGADVLRHGGNAIDAAVATQFALNVVEPQSSGIGGGGFMLVYLAATQQTVIVDARETAPAAATPDMFLLASQPAQAFPFDIRSTSGLAVGAPGTVRGLATALDRWGSWPFAATLQPAIRLAEQGFRVSAELAANALSSRLDSEPGNPAYDAARAVFRPGGKPLQKGDLLKQPELAGTLRLLAEKGPDAFYAGPLAEAIIAVQRHARRVADPADQARLVGRMTLADLAGYRAALRAPLEGDYRGYRIVTMPPPSAGGVALLQTLKMLEPLPLGDRSQGYGFGAPRTLHALLEALRLAFADAALWLGDPAFFSPPVTGLLAAGYLQSRRAQIDPDRRRADIMPGDPRPFDQKGEPAPPLRPPTPAPATEGVNTTHFTLIDRDGNIVAYTSTIESAWGTGLMVPGYGFLLNNELTDFNAVPTFDVIGGFNPGANDVAPGKRPRSSMTPTLILRDGRPRAAYGSPGGPTIIATVAGVTMNLIDHRAPLQEAIAAPRIALTSPVGGFAWEQDLGDEVIQALRKLGHAAAAAPVDLGAVQAVIIDPLSGRQLGGADPRRGGTVVSVRREEIQRRPSGASAPAPAGAK